MENDIFKSEEHIEFLSQYTGVQDLSKLTPMFKQYLEQKVQARDCILFYRLGDFYEMFFEDARVVSSELDLVLTGRDGGLKDRIEMCGVPQISHESYLAKLVNRGHKVAICEQITQPGKGLVQREIVRIVTQGTALDQTMLGDDVPNFMCCVCGVDNSDLFNYKKPQLSYGVAWADVSTGQFNIQTCENEAGLIDLLSKIRPKEIICNDVALVPSFDLSIIKAGDCPKFSKYYDWAFEIDAATTLAKQKLNLDNNQVKDQSLAVCAIGALLEYISQMHKSRIIAPSQVNISDKKDTMSLNHFTLRTLELVNNMRDGSNKGTLNNTINIASTDMGKRKLRNWILSPLLDCDAINDRLDIVGSIAGSLSVSDGLHKHLKAMKDIERLGMRVLHKRIRPVDLVVLGKSLENIPNVISLLKKLDTDGTKNNKLKELINTINSHEELCTLLTKSLLLEPAAKPQDGYIFADGYDTTLDEIREYKAEVSDLIAHIEKSEREATGIQKLRVTFNRVSGYFIEVPLSMTNKVPYSYVRKQTLASIERYITKDLKMVEDRILSSGDDIIKRETWLLEQFMKDLCKFIPDLLKTADALAELDCYLAFARCATMYNYTRPVIVSDERVLEIVEGRHPIVERVAEKFVPNDIHLDKDSRTMIITGPNMSGKSVYMRQVALIAVMAQIGCFVPAQSCKISPMTDIFARIGGGDDMLSGRSTFMVEMAELATILVDTPDDCLILLDELGRGTATYDGISIAKASVEHLVYNTKAFTLFSTHYQELTELETLPNTHNYNMSVHEKDGTIVFDNKLVKGKASKSFGINVAGLSGIPQEIIDRAESILKEIV